MTTCKTNRNYAAATLSVAARAIRRLRIACVAPTAHPVLVGNRNYLRSLRAAEMAAWEAGLPLPLAKSFSETIARSVAE